jgi:hypothetical protein
LPPDLGRRIGINVADQEAESAEKLPSRRLNDLIVQLEEAGIEFIE